MRKKSYANHGKKNMRCIILLYLSYYILLYYIYQYKICVLVLAEIYLNNYVSVLNLLVLSVYWSLSVCTLTLPSRRVHYVFKAITLGMVEILKIF